MDVLPSLREVHHLTKSPISRQPRRINPNKLQNIDALFVFFFVETVLLPNLLGKAAKKIQIKKFNNHRTTTPRLHTYTARQRLRGSRPMSCQLRPQPLESIRAALIQRGSTLLSVHLEKRAKKYWLEVTADLGGVSTRWRSEYIKYPKSNKNARDWVAEEAFATA